MKPEVFVVWSGVQLETVGKFSKLSFVFTAYRLVMKSEFMYTMHMAKITRLLFADVTGYLISMLTP